MPEAPNPYVELTYGSSALDFATRQVLHTPRTERTTEDALRDALMAWRTYAITNAKAELATLEIVDVATINRVLDTLWQVYFPTFGKLTLPFVFRSYRDGFAAARAGNVSIEYLDELALDYVRRTGEYFHSSSKEALAQGFTTFVNRKNGTRVALRKSLQAYGLTPRQMSGLTSLAESKVENGVVASIRSKAQGYITNALRERLNTFSRQEAHNLDQQAQQAAWLWLHDQGRLSEDTVKVWLTARDEKVCPICGPLHNKRVPVLEKFEVMGGSLWVPGAHPNCRCEVKLITPLSVFQKDLIGDALAEFNDEHPRGEGGRFSAKQRAAATLERKREASSNIFRPLENYVALKEHDDEVQLDSFLHEAQRKAELGAERDRIMQLLKDNPVKPTITTAEVPRIGTAPRIGGITIGQPKITISDKPALDNKIKLGSKISLPKFQLSTQNKIRFESTPTILVDALRRIDMKQKSQPPKKLGYRPTIVYPEMPIALYAVAGRYEFDHDMKIDPAGKSLTTDMTSASIAANDLFQRNMEMAYLTVGERFEYRVEDTDIDGSEMYADINPEEAMDIIQAMAWGQVDPRGDFHGERIKTAVEWYYASDDSPVLGDDRPTEMLSYAEIAEEWDLTPQQFEVHIVQLNEGHDSSLGQTRMLDRDRHGEIWEATGNYVGYTEPLDRHGMTAPIRITLLRPDVETEMFGEHNE